jgi:hypothetical protein
VTATDFHLSKRISLLGPAAILLGLALAATAAAEPEVQLRVGRGPYYVGQPVEVHVHTTGFSREPQPTVDVNPPSGGSLRLAGVVPNISSSMQIVNGRIFQSETVTYTFKYEFVSASAGSYRIGPFRVSQNGVEGVTQPYALKVREVPIDPQLRIRLLVPPTPVYVGQRVALTIEWWLEERLRDKLSSYSIRSELFERDDLFQFITDDPPADGAQTLEIETASGQLRLAAEVEQRRHGGRRYLVVTSQREMVPLRAGAYDLTPATVNAEEVTRWTRDFFGGRRPGDTRRIFSRDESRRLVVKPTPSEGRPDSFAGAVGQGFSFDVAADRSVVQLGDPITLQMTVRGAGNLAIAGPPRLDAAGALRPEHFRLPDRDVAGEITDDAKVFEIALRVLDDAVREIPALPYAYFDPEIGQYRTVYSRPIALSVRPAQVISADDVVATRRTRVQPGEVETLVEGNGGPEAAPARRGSFSLIGADLSITKDASALLRRSSHARAPIYATYGGSLALLAIAGWLRRRSDVDPALRHQRAVLRTQAKRIRAASVSPGHESLQTMAAGFREILAAAPGLRGDAVDDFVRRCDEVVYAPDAGGAGAETLASQAEDLLLRMEAELS